MDCSFDKYVNLQYLMNHYLIAPSIKDYISIGQRGSSIVAINVYIFFFAQHKLFIQRCMFTLDVYLVYTSISSYLLF